MKSIKATCSGFPLNLSEEPPLFRDLTKQVFEFTGECTLESLYSTSLMGRTAGGCFVSFV